MKLFYQVNKVLLVIAALCFIFIVVPGKALSAKNNNRKPVLYKNNDCNGNILIQEKGRSICIRSNTAEIHPGNIARMYFE